MRPGARNGWIHRLPRIAALAILALAATLFAFWVERQSLLPWNVPLFSFGVAIFLYLPGRLTLRAFGWSGEGIPIALALATGLPVALALFYVTSPFLPIHAYTALAIILCIVWLWRSRPPLRRSVKVQSLASLAAGTLVAAFALWALSQTTYRGGQRASDGGLSYAHSRGYLNVKVGGSDALFHAAITGTLARTLSLESNPFLAGETLSYHYGMDLLAALFARELGIHPLDLTSRLFPTLFLLTLCALVFRLGQAMGLSSAWSLLATLLIFGADLGILLYLFPVYPDWPLKYWVGVFSEYPATSFFWVNPQLPALVILTAAVIVLAGKADDRRGRILAGLLLGATVLFKVFLAFHVAIALGAASAVLLLRGRGRGWVEITAVAGVVMLASAIASGFYGESRVDIFLAYFPTVFAKLRVAGLDPLAIVLREAKAVPSVTGLFQTVSVVAFYLVMVLGVRIAVVPTAFQWTMSKTHDPARLFLAFFFIVGLVPPLFVSFRASYVNNSFWFINQSLFAASILLADRIHRMKSKHHRVAAVCLSLALSLPPTLKKIHSWGHLENGHLSAGELAASLHLREEAGSSDVVIHPLSSKTPSPGSHLGGLPTVLTHWQGFPLSFANPAEVKKRQRNVKQFFLTEDPETAREILETYNVRWVYELKEKRPVRFPPETLLEKDYENREVVLYRVNSGTFRPSPYPLPKGERE